MFADASEYICAELQRLDLLLYRQILRLRATYQLSLDEFRGLYISDEQVDSFLNQVAAKENSSTSIEHLTEQAEALRVRNLEQASAASPWKQVIEEFHLSPFEQDVLLLALAPEVDLKYETLYAYLNNDVTRKWPTYDMALRLFSGDATQRIQLRSSLLPQAPLFRAGLLQAIHSTQDHPARLAGGFSITPTVAHDLLGLPAYNAILAPYVEYSMPTTGWESVPLSETMRTTIRRALNLFAHSPSPGTPPILVFEGRSGSGRSLAAEALCKELAVPMLRVDVEAMHFSQEQMQHLAQGLLLQQRLLHAALYFAYADAFFDKEGNPLSESYHFAKLLAQGNVPLFLACSPGVRWRDLLQGQHAIAFHFDYPDHAERRHLWQTYLVREGHILPDETLSALAERFILNPGQIQAAVSAAVDSHRMQGEPEQELSFAVLSSAAHAQSDQSLGNLAVKVAIHHSWDDVVLPPATLRRVKEVAAAIKNRSLVYTEWGFEQRIAMGRGLKILFTGSSGTGKTMTAGVIAHDLGLELYKIDLSSIVSKYIGETEKNLDRIFRAAHNSNAILFFDEADALFGKRSEVKDAHDRYANIEVAYLLQKMEEHEGVVILASNLSKNIDEAFSRRVHYVVEFPLPDETHRGRLWHGMFPVQVPLSRDVDFPFLARQFPMAGGDIKNVALEAAFLAAQDGQVVTMKHLVKAMARQMKKQGQLASPSDFKQYHALIMQEE